MKTTVVSFLRDAALFAALGLVVGVLTVALSAAVDGAAAAFAAWPPLGWLLPVAGLATYGLYRALRVDFAWSTAWVVEAVRDGEAVPLRLVPAIVAGTALTVLGGGSAGKEAAALQMAAGASGPFRRWLRPERQGWAAPAAMAAALGAMLSAPAAGVVFSFEVLRRRPSDAGACAAPVIAAVAAWAVTEAAGVRFLPPLGEAALSELPWPGAACPALGPGTLDGALGLGGLLLLGILAGAAAGVVALAFCRALGAMRRGLARLGAPVFALAVGGAAVSLVLGYADVLGYGDVRAFCGTGANLVIAALADAALPWWAFALKALLTLCTFAGGFKGGEIMPVLAIGACLGGAVGAGPLIVIVGMVAFFAACTKCPLTALVMAAELFGIAPGILCLPAIATACLCSPSASLYPTTLGSGPGVNRSPRRR